MSDEYLDEMMNQAPGAINFTMFLTLFGERLQVITQGNIKNDVTQWGTNLPFLSDRGSCKDLSFFLSVLPAKALGCDVILFAV